MPIAPSPLERWFTTHPGPLRHMLAMTCAAPWRMAELEERLPEGWTLGIELGYADPEGDPELRGLVAGELGVARAEVLLTQGAVEANWLALQALVRPGMRVAIQQPIYAQLPLVAAGLGAEVVAWAPGVEAELVVLNSPHNPTGEVVPAEVLAAEIARQRAAGRWVLVDEVYRGVGDAPLPPSALGHGREHVLISGSLSKGAALPGLRLGWLAGDARAIEQAMPLREHSTLALAGPAQALAKALWAAIPGLTAANQALLAANRRRLRETAEGWGWRVQAAETAGVALLTPPTAVDDVAVAERWHAEARGLVVPGSVCGYPGSFRVGYGQRDPEVLAAALASFKAHA